MAGINNTFLCVIFLSIPIVSFTTDDYSVHLRKCCYDEFKVLQMKNGTLSCENSYIDKPAITVYNSNTGEKKLKHIEDFEYKNISESISKASKTYTYYYCKVMDDGTLRKELTDELIPNSCFDFELVNNKELVPICVYWSTPSTEEMPKYLQELKNIAMFVSTFSLVLVLSIYFVLKKMRNLNGLMTITWVFCVLNGLLDLAIIRRHNFKLLTCKVLVAYLYFITLSSFSWMTVISFDIWLMSRNHHQVIARRNVKTFYMLIKYSIVAFAVPSLMALIQYLMKNTTDDSHIIREVACTINGHEKNIYLYVPTIVLILCTTFFYGLTEYNLRKHFQDTMVLYNCSNKRRVQKQKNRLWLFITLSAVLELLWMFEVVSAQFPAYPLYWYVPDLINCLKGLWIFMIFIYKGQTCKLLKQKLQKKNVKKEVKVVNSLEKEKELTTSFKLQNISTTTESY